jgi:hypothetical protein
MPRCAAGDAMAETVEVTAVRLVHESAAHARETSDRL